MDNNKVNLDFSTISQALKAFPLPEVDHVVGIAEGGIVPASLIADQINRPLSLIQINYRARDNSPRIPGRCSSPGSRFRSGGSASFSWMKLPSAEKR